MADDKTKKVSAEQDNYQFDDAACSAEFGGEGCKLQDDETAEEK